MAERAIQERQFAYATNASQVLEADQEGRRRRNEPSGAAESLVGKILPKMGDRAMLASEEIKKREERREQLKREKTVKDTMVDKRRKTGAISINKRVNNVITAVDEYSSKLYRPKTTETEIRYSKLLAIITRSYPDASGDVIADLANEVLAVMKDGEVRGKQSRCESLLGKMNEREFGDLVELCKEITDFNVEEEGEEEDKEDTVALDMNIESDDSVLDEVMSDDDDDDDDDDDGLKQTNTLRNQDDKMMEEESGLRVVDIDSFWLQRRINEYEKDPEKSQELSEKILSVLQNVDEREGETQLLELVGVEHSDLISLLLTNRAMIAYVIRWRQATSEPAKQSIAEEMLADLSIDGAAILQALESKRSTKDWESARGGLTMNEELRGRRTAKEQGQEREAEGLREEEMRGVASELAMPKPKAQLILRNLEFTAGNHLMSKKTFRLPEGTHKLLKPGREEIHVPAATNKYSDAEYLRSHKLVAVDEMPEWFRAGFEGVKKLNLVQSRVYECAMMSSENMLLCAPTGAGKTNVALMAILHEMWLHRREDGSVDKDKFKIVYVAPMKALVREMVESFSRKLKIYGITVRELSGDISLTKEEIASTQIIITTPEKWDIITRKSGDRTYTQLVRLIIIDEIHLLHDDRGPVLESLVARTVRQVEVTQEMVRLVGLSATLPNYQDVAMFLRVDSTKGLFHFDSSFRPVGLEQQFVGVTEKSSFKSMTLMNEICYEKVMDKAGKKQVLVFVHSRKETAKTAQYLLDQAVEKDQHHLFFPSEVSKQELEDAVKQYPIKSEDLKKLLPTGFAIHHAGLCRSDRTAVEELFGRGLIQVLVSTMTLAWGVNLPAHTVIIKGTQMYSPEQSTWVELSPQDILQMLGRAGRPQFEKCGEGIIITKAAELQYYLSLMSAQLPIESQFIKKLADNLNAEIVMGTVQNMSEAVAWLGYTYLFVRMLKNPILYGVDPLVLKDDPTLLQHRVDLIHSAANQLAKNALVKYDVKTGIFERTGLGRIASFYYITNASVATYNENLKPGMTEIELFRLFSMSNEFAQITVRPEEKLELESLMKKVPIPIRETVDNPCAKVNVMLQAYISRVKLEKFAMACDMVYITQSAGRILRALFEISLLREWSTLTQRCLTLCKMVTHQQWDTQNPLRQFGKLPASILKRLDNKPIAFDRYHDMTAVDLEELASGRNDTVKNIGAKLEKLVHKVPRMTADATILPITRSMLSVELALTADFTYDIEIHGPSQGFHLLVEDGDGEQILYYQYWLLKAKYAEETQYINFTVPLFDPMPPQYFLRIISDSWLKSETTHIITFRSLILPEKFPPHTELLDLQPLSLSALHNPLYEALYASSITSLNPIQTQSFASIYESDMNVLLAARAGSGKGVMGELAMMRLFASQSDAKVIFLCPVNEVCKIKEERFRDVFEKGLGKRVGRFIGNSKEDTQTLTNCSVIITSPTDLDYYTCKGLHMKLLQYVRLIVIDRLHMIGSPNGHLMEIVISRLRAMEAQAKADPAARFQLRFRFVALSACLANARSLAGWLGVDKGLISFHSSVKALPVQVRVQGFDINHPGTRLLAMSKPVYTAVAALSAEKAALVFVPSRKQAQMTAIDLLTFVSASVRPRRFNHVPEEQMEQVLESVIDPALKTVLTAGVAFVYKGMNTSDFALVLQLYSNDYIQVLVATHDLCWSLSLSSHLVIIMDTCFYDGKDHRFVDYPISDLLQMQGVAARPGRYSNGKVIVFCHSAKKAYLNKFLFEPLPVESSLHLNLGDALNAGVVSKTVGSMQDAVEWLTWFFFYRRLPQNPMYYALNGVSDEQMSEYVSVLTENTMEELSKAGAVEMNEEGDLSPLNLGVLSAHLYIKFHTTELFALSVTAKAKRRGLLQILSSSTEFETMPIRQHEQLTLKRMETHLPYVVENPTVVSRKINVLLQTYFGREAVPADLRRDTVSILPICLRLLHGMMNVCSTNMWLKPAIAAIELCQMVVQGLWNEDSRLLQLPHFDKERSRGFESEGVDNLFDFIEMEDETRLKLLEGLNEKEIADIVSFCNDYPDIEVSAALEQDTVQTEEETVLRVKLSTGEEEEEFNTEVKSEQFPQKLRQTWWLMLGDPQDNSIMAIAEVDLDRSNEKELTFTAPSEPGHYKWMLYFMTDSYIGCDQEQEIEFDVIGDSKKQE